MRPLVVGLLVACILAFVAADSAAVAELASPATFTTPPPSDYPYFPVKPFAPGHEYETLRVDLTSFRACAPANDKDALFLCFLDSSELINNKQWTSR